MVTKKSDFFYNLVSETHKSELVTLKSITLALTTSFFCSNTAKEKKKKGLSLSSLKSPFKFLGKTYCKGCHKKCSGEVLRVGDLYFHNGCFNCKGCSISLSQGKFAITHFIYVDILKYNFAYLISRWIFLQRQGILLRRLLSSEFWHQVFQM